MTAEDVRIALRRHYGVNGPDFLAEEWALIDELALKARNWTEARIDCLAVRCWSGPPKGHERVAIEIKVSRADYKREMESEKWRSWYRLAHRFAFATPAGLLSLSEVPAECGLIEVSERGLVTWRRQGPRHEPETPPESLFAEVVRRLSRHEARIRSGSMDDPAAEIVRLRAEVKSLEGQVTTADARVERHKQRVRLLLEDLGADATCVCTRPIKYHRGRGKWLHSDVAATEHRSRYCADDDVRRFGEWARPASDDAASEVESA